MRLETVRSAPALVHVPVMVSRHADKRVRQRLGLKRSAVARTVQKAWEYGKHLAHLDGQGPGRSGSRFHQLGAFIFVFACHAHGIVCMTVLRADGSADWRDEGEAPQILAYRAHRREERRKRIKRRRREG